MKAISLRAFSSMTLGSCDVQRKQFGAKTIAKLDESILVLATISGWANCCRKCTKYVSTWEKNAGSVVKTQRKFE